MAKLARIDFEEVVVAPGDAEARAEILLLSPSILVPCLTYKGIRVWDTLAIGEFLNEIAPKAELLPKDQAVRAHCRSVCGEMHSGFVALRQALPMNIKAQFPSFKIWSKARADIDRIVIIWSECLQAYGGPFLFGKITDGGRDVRAGGEPVSHLRDQARRGIEKLRRAHLGSACDAGVARRRVGGRRGDRGAGGRVLVRTQTV